MTLPFTFAWVNETDTTFNPSTMNVFDEVIVSVAITHEEGQIPSLSMTIKNPRVGLLAPGRKVWGWLAWQSPADDPIYAGALVPLFFGVLVGIPSNLFKETITIEMIARSPDFIMNKQAVAETMKIAPYYDPFWFDTTHRDDPDSILEGWSALWHIDRTTLDITASDVLTGEDGSVTFDEGTAIYESVGMTLGQAPLANVRVQATCTWTQRSSGFFTVPTVNVQTYTGDTFIGDWPKAGASIGGGYKCESSFVNDVYNVAITPTTNYQSSWTSTDTNPGQCSNASAESSSSGPALLSPDPISFVITGEFTSGVCFPDSDPPQNIPAKTSVTGMIIPLWAISADMTMRYDASRQFSEVLVFDMIGSTQGVLASPTVSQDTELVTISSVDLGKPLQNLLAWTDFAGRAVPFTQIIYPNNPTTPGGLSFQICLTPGTAGTVEPVFSDFAGVETTDGSVVWASLGTNPLTDAPSWSPAAFVPAGQIICLQDQVFNPASGTYEDIPDATSYYVCIKSGQTNTVYHTFTFTPTIVSNDEAPPAQRIINIIDPPTFSQTAGTAITDGSVQWLVLGKNPATLTIPIGGTPDDVRANNYFPTTRGLQSVEFLISKARARLRFRARAVTINWQAAFNTGVGLSCRKNATLFDPRLPGGAANGKIISYKLTADQGKMLTSVSIGCAVGFGDSIAEITGTPEYASPGYMQSGYQRFDGAMGASGSGDVTFSKPAFTPFDDGLTFPLNWQMISDGGIFSGDLATQKAAILASSAATRVLAYAQKWAGNVIGTGNTSSSQSGISPGEAWALEREQLAYTTQLTPYVMASNPISWTALLKPCAGNGPFEGAYSITVSPLVMPQGINLEAPSSP